MSEDGGSEARGHFSGGEKSNKESAIGKQEFSESRQNAEERVRTGEDTEGHFLFISLSEKFSESPDTSRFGAVANTYKDAKDALGKIEDPAELEKAIISLRSFHESVGLGKYLVNIEADANTTPEQRRELIKQKVAEDVAKMPEQFAIHEMSDYLDHRARTDHLQNKLKSSLPMGEIYGKGIDPVKIPPRQHARIDAYDMQGEADRAYWSGQRLVDRISDDRVSREFHDIRSQRLSLTEESAVPLAEREEEEREKMVGERIVSLRQQIEESRGKKYAETFDNLPENEKKYLASCLIDDEEEIRVAGKNFETALKSEDADRIVGTVSKSKEARVKLKESLGRVDVALAEQLSKNASSRLIQIRKEIASGGGRQHWLSKEEVNKGLSAVKEKISSFVGKNVAKLKAEIAPVLDKVMQKAESVDDALFRGVIWVGEKFDATVGRAAKAVKDKLSEIRRNISDVMKRISSGIERKKLSLRKNYYDKRHAINVAKDRAMSNLGIANLEAKHKAALRVRKIIGGSALSEEERKEFDKKKERISEAVERLKGIKTKEHDKTSENNPHYEHFWREIDEYVKHVKLPRTETSQVIEEPGKKEDRDEVDESTDLGASETEDNDSTVLNTEVVVVSKLRESRTNLTDYEILKYKDNNGEHNILVWTDGKKVETEEVDERLAKIKDYTTYELKEDANENIIEDPKVVIDRSLKELTSKYDETTGMDKIDYKRGLVAGVDSDGNLVIVEPEEQADIQDDSMVEPSQEVLIKGDKTEKKEKKKKEPMTEGEFKNMYPGIQEHEVVKYKDKGDGTRYLLAWVDDKNRFRVVKISRYGRHYVKESLINKNINNYQEAEKLFDQKITGLKDKGLVSDPQKGYSFEIDKKGLVQIVGPKEQADIQDDSNAEEVLNEENNTRENGEAKEVVEEVDDGFDKINQTDSGEVKNDREGPVLERISFTEICRSIVEQERKADEDLLLHSGPKPMAYVHDALMKAYPDEDEFEKSVREIANTVKEEVENYAGEGPEEDPYEKAVSDKILPKYEKFNDALKEVLEKPRNIYSDDEGTSKIDREKLEDEVKIVSEFIHRVISEEEKVKLGDKTENDGGGNTPTAGNTEAKGQRVDVIEAKRLGEEIERTEAEKALVENIDELYEEVLKTKDEHENTNDRISNDNYLVAVRAWEDKLYELNKYLTDSINMKSRDLAGINEFDEYNSNSLRLDKAYKEIKNIQSDSASSVEEERKLVSMYEAVLMDNSRIYNSLRAQNLI